MINKIRFLGVFPSFGYNQIGGTDSFFRRIALELESHGNKIEFVHYGYPANRSWSPTDNLTVHEFVSFRDALDHLSKKDGPLLVNAVKAADRLSFILFRWKMRKQIKFYMVYSFFGETFLQHLRHFLEAWLYPYNGGAICMSQRLVEKTHKWRQKSHLLLPPIPDELLAQDNSGNSLTADRDLTIGYIGRLEYAKGGSDAVSILKQTSQMPGIKGYVSAYDWDEDCNRPAESATLWKQLKSMDNIDCTWKKRHEWSMKIDDELFSRLSKIHILLLPYKQMSSSVDTPLLLLEGMACGCAIITRPLGDIPNIYGKSPFIIKDNNFITSACKLIQDLTPEQLNKEKERVAKQLKTLNCGTKAITEKLLKILSDSSASIDG